MFREMSGNRFGGSLGNAVRTRQSGHGNDTDAVGDDTTFSETFTRKGHYFFFHGTVKATGTWQGFRCDRGTKWVEQAYGKAKTFSAEVQGTVRCGDTVNKNSLGRLVQQKYC